MAEGRNVFATAIETFAIGGERLRAALERCCWVLAEEDEAGLRWSESEGYPGYTSYASLDDLPARFPEFATLVSELDRAVAAFARRRHWDLSAGRLVLDAIWVNMLGEGGHHSGHIHPGSAVSGTYYVSVPAGAGALKFEDPRLALMMSAPPVEQHAPETARRFIYIPPTEGTALLWESWLRHEVMPNGSEDVRISVSFNYAYRPDGPS